MPAVDETTDDSDGVDATDAALIGELRAAIDDAGARIAAVLDPACPTASFLVALREELTRASTDPSSVPHPELVDPDSYWNASVKPQAIALNTTVAQIVTWLEERVIGIMEVAETSLKAMVDAAAEERVDPALVRADLADRIDARCMSLHHLMAEALAVVPDSASIEASRAALDEAVREQATEDVGALKDLYLREAGGDAEHQRFAEIQWAETLAERIAHRDALLRAEPPWRHQELALAGFEQTRAQVSAGVEEAVARLQTPLLEMRDLLLARFDARVAERSH